MAEEASTEAAETSDMVIPRRIFLRVEHGVYTALGSLLAIVAVVALVHAAVDVVTGVVAFNDNKRLLSIMDQLLVVLMLAEILHTVRASMRSGSLTAEPFLVVGLIASIRRVLVITLESSDATQVPTAAPEEGVFNHSMIELGVLGMLILVMVVSIFLLRRCRPATPEEQADE
jgi:phosphate starvation-inducible membrane PsiE